MRAARARNAALKRTRQTAIVARAVVHDASRQDAAIKQLLGKVTTIQANLLTIEDHLTNIDTAIRDLQTRVAALEGLV